jgi:glutamine amidotransferase
MCELMALSFAAPSRPGFALRAFAERGDENPDGWGFAWYPDASLAMVKEPVRWRDSRLAAFLTEDPTLEGRIHLAHVRHKTIGGAPTHSETHPFRRELGGRDYVFAHNGTLEGPAWDLPLGRHLPLGGTDSERFFCHLLGLVENRGTGLDTEADWRWLHETLANANRFGKLNVLMSDGRWLFCYHDVNGWKGLNYRRMSVGESGIAGEGGWVATCPLDEGDWTSFGLGELLVFGEGRLQFSSR